MQMLIAGNRPRTIERYKYIFKQFVEVCRIEFVEDIKLDKLYPYLDVQSKFYNYDWVKDRFWSNFQIK